ncbi:MAG TPA: class I SAM-dependent methyltransferase [Gemmatimonadaceae bacterium]|nr:class I SAM-dependent methyltransferase [Gemmatimonadaceae bacterium]
MTSPSSATARRDAFVERMLRSAAGVFEIFSIHLGDRLGYYTALAGAPLTAAELARRTGTHERYVREWLEQQTVAGILEVSDPAAPAAEQRFVLPVGHDEVLADAESLNYLAPLAQILAGAVRPMDAVLDAYRGGGGVPYADYGADMREGQARVNRAMFLQQLGREWLPAIADVDARLRRSDVPARVADVGCGAGWSSIGIARSYPHARVDGFDLDEPSIALARANAEEAGVGDRVRFAARDAGDPALAGRYDLVIALECVHDMSDPVSALRTMRRLAGDDGAVLVVDERVGDGFLCGATDIEWMMYGWSVLHCLPVGMAEQPSAATGTVLRPDTLRRYAREAGFRDVEILPIENFVFRIYRLQ